MIPIIQIINIKTKLPESFLLGKDLAKLLFHFVYSIAGQTFGYMLEQSCHRKELF